MSLRLFATDLDGTLIGNPTATRRFIHAWSELPAETRPLLCFNSGRLITEIEGLIKDGALPRPDLVIGGVGTQIVDWRTRTVLEAWERELAVGWDRARVEHLVAGFPGATVQPECFQTPYKSSWYLPEADDERLDALRALLAEEGLQAQVVYSNNRDLDLLPAAADKGQALAWLCRHLDIPTDAVLVAGDRGNDASMYLLPGVRGILVENAQPELERVAAYAGATVHHSSQHLAEGLLDGLLHFGVLSALPETGHETARAIDPELRLLFDTSSRRQLSAPQLAYLQQAYGHALDAVRRNVTPVGFSACSLTDNDVTGTDANYRSVWGRDGAITLISSLCTGEADLVLCARHTLETLLGATKANGHVPANVRIDDLVPDYSGVGGICAIDSAIWLVIAFYHYVTRSDDGEFLARWAPTITAIMHWLGAHDANADGLLEIPEASDWTDLFGRSYNVLYDEVLWYRACVCWARLLERMQRCDEAAELHQQSQRVRGAILRAFWPSTTRSDDPGTPTTTFADLQYTLGDARYLLAEVSPFSFNWRCDVLGNVLAFLTNVLDVPRARTALAFMWGCGVNDPWPVTNLYPVVQSGDPDWRPYYTVNLLNLPHHYHNGGIWPFIGSMWVRFIDRLGQHDVACQELVRVAECCQLGRSHAWEFNEWYHGQTGRPMGKAYQAWSAAAFIRACHELGIVSSSCAPTEPGDRPDDRTLLR